MVKEVNAPTMRAIMKYQNHSSVLTILDKYKNNSILSFPHVTKEEVLKEIDNLDTTKSSQDRYSEKNNKTEFEYICIFYT